MKIDIFHENMNKEKCVQNFFRNFQFPYPIKTVPSPPIHTHSTFNKAIKDPGHANILTFVRLSIHIKGGRLLAHVATY